MKAITKAEAAYMAAVAELGCINSKRINFNEGCGQMAIRLKKIRDFAQGQDCTTNTPGCNYDIETSRLIHYRSHDDGAGIALKPDDSSAAIACSGCDLWLGEGNRGSKATDSQGIADYCNRQFYWFRGCRRTWRLLIENGVLK
jgi:hypothetical protein